MIFVVFAFYLLWLELSEIKRPQDSAGYRFFTLIVKLFS